MTKSKQRKALAKLDGWTYHEYICTKESGDPYSPKMCGAVWIRGDWNLLDYQEQESHFDKEIEPPYYHADFNAIILLIQKQPPDIKRKFTDELIRRNYSKNGELYSESPSQLGEVLLKVANEWED